MVSQKVEPVKHFVRRYAMAISFIFVAFAGGYTVQLEADRSNERLYESQVESCQRGNKLRTESNQRVQGLSDQRDILAEFLLAAARAREEAGSPTDVRTAAKYRELAEYLDRHVHFNSVPLVDCNKEIPRP